MFKKNFGCGSLILVFVLTVAIILVGGYFAFTNYLSPYLNNAQIQEVYKIYIALSEDVNESELITNAPQAADYESAKTKLIDSGINIFNEYGDIDPAKIEESNFFATNDIVLTDKQLASIINEFIKNPLNLQKVGIDPDTIGGLKTEVLEVNISSTIESQVTLSFVVKLDMTSIKNELGFFGLFLPNELYVTNVNTLELVGEEYSLINGSIKVNNLDEATNTRMLEILVEALKSNNPNLTLDDIQKAMGNIILKGIQEVSNTFHTNIQFSNGAIAFQPNNII